MQVTVRFLLEAEVELHDAVAFYNAQHAGLGNRLAAEISEGLARIVEYPHAWPLIGRRVRRYRLLKFPYGLVYVPLPSEIAVVAVMHLHREPAYWKARLR